MVENKAVGERIAASRKELGLTVKELADKSGYLIPSTISSWEQGVRTPKLKEFKTLSKLLKVPTTYLLCLTDDISENDASFKVPLLNMEQAKDYKTYLKKSFKDNSSQSLTIDQSLYPNVSKNTFAVILNDQSMQPDFIINDILVIDPDEKPSPGKYVLANVKNEILFRKYKERLKKDNSVEVILTPLNDDWPAVNFNTKSKNYVIGTLFETRRSFTF